MQIKNDLFMAKLVAPKNFRNQALNNMDNFKISDIVDIL